MEELQEIYEAHTCGHCQENEATLDHIAEHYILLPVRDIKVDDVVGHKGPKS
jgi:hypothetical protein